MANIAHKLPKVEKNMTKIKGLIAATGFAVIMLGLPAIASAQYGGYDPYGRNNGGYSNGGYYGGGDTRSVIRDLKNRARDFQRQLDRDLDRSRYNGTRREDQMNNLARRFKDAVDNLDNNGYYNNNRNNNRGDNEIRRVFNEASQIERTIGRAGVSYQSQAIWSGIRNDLQQLSRSYGNGGNNGRNNGGWGNNRNRNGLPSWWPF
jgi:hypothetical protein